MAVTRKRRLYHVTTRDNLSEVIERGVWPRKGINGVAYGDPSSGVLCFDSRDAVDAALAGWLGEQFRDNEEGEERGRLIVVEFWAFSRLIENEPDHPDAIDYRESLPCELIITVYDQDWKPIDVELPRDRLIGNHAGTSRSPKT